MQANSKLRSRAGASLRSLSGAASVLTRAQVVTVIALIVLLGTGALMTLARARPSMVRVLDKSVSLSSEPTARTLTVHVAGAVNNPGLYKLNEGSRVADALGRAGGPAQGAILDDINLAARLTDGEKVMVPRQAVPADGNAAEATAATGSTSSSRVNINTASEAQLDVLPGVGPALAARIVQYRDKNGPFSSVDELDNVSGIGPSKLDSLKDLVAI